MKFKRIFLVSTFVFLFSACGIGDSTDIDEDAIDEMLNNDGTAEDNDETQDQDTDDEDNDSESETDDSEADQDPEDESEEEQEPDETPSEELSEEEAIDRVIAYVSEFEDIDPEGLRTTVQDSDEGDYLVQLFEFGPEGEDEQHTATLGWYTVDKQTGEVANRMDHSPHVYVSEIASMTDENRENHHRNIAENPNDLSAEVFENLMLPGMHANTEEYQGRVNQNNRLTIEFFTGDTLSPEVDGDGYFVADLTSTSINEGDTIRFVVSGDNYSTDQVFDITVHFVQDGMEVIHVND